MVSVIAASAAAFCSALLWLFVRRLQDIAQARRVALEQLGSQQLADLFIFLDANQLARAVSIALLILPLLLFLISGSGWLAAAMALLILTAPAAIVRLLRQRRLRRLARSLPDAIFALASLLRSGAALGSALTTLPRYLQRPLADEVSLLVRQLRLGMPLQIAVRKWAMRINTHESRGFASLLTVVHAQGGALAPALEQLADAGRRRLAVEDRIAALTAQGRMQGVVVTLLPLGVGAVLWQLDPDAMHPLFHSARGLTVCAVVLVLQLTGWWGIRRIMDIRV